MKSILIAFSLNSGFWLLASWLTLISGIRLLTSVMDDLTQRYALCPIPYAHLGERRKK
jgi:hypothetical protein